MTDGVGCFPQLIARIDRVLNKYGKIKDTATPELLNIRHTIEVTSRGISHSLRSIINQAQADGYIDRDVSPTLRDGRLVIPVAPALKRKIKGIIHDESATGKTVFIEPAAVVDANNRIRELKAAERREIIRILQILSTSRTFSTRCSFSPTSTTSAPSPSSPSSSPASYRACKPNRASTGCKLATRYSSKVSSATARR